MIIKPGPWNFDYYESEIEPPLEGPKLWFRPSDQQHFARLRDGWAPYNPVNKIFKLAEGESVAINIPNP